MKVEGMLIDLARFIGDVSDRRSSTVMFSLATAVVFGALDAAFETRTSRKHEHPCPHTFVRASSIGVAAGITALVLLEARRDRRARIRGELTRLFELNHRLRNSLQIIADAHYLEPNDEHRGMMFETVSSMDETLKQLFPSVGLPADRAA